MSATRYTVTIPFELAGERLDKALTALLLPRAELSRARVQALIEGGDVHPSQTVKYAVKAGEVFEVNLPEVLEPSAAVAENIPLDIVYEDDDVLVLNKAAGMVVHPAAGNFTGTLVNALLWHKKDALSGIGGVERPGIVHRLDKDTSGLMVVAKHDKAHQKLSKQFEKRSLSRTYLAVVWGVPMPREGTIDAPIGRSPADRKKMAVVAKGGKEAVTHYEVVKVLAGGALCLVRCQLETGRTHQIRVHLTHIGHPLVGDPAYGGQRRRAVHLPEPYKTAATSFTRQALHAAQIHFISPTSGEMLEFEVDLPQDMQDLLATLQG